LPVIKEVHGNLQFLTIIIVQHSMHISAYISIRVSSISK